MADQDFESPKNKPQEGLQGRPTDPLSLDIPDEELADIIDQRISDSRHFYEEKYKLYDRRRKNEIHYFGRQVMEREKENSYKYYESKYMDNVLYEIEATIKPLAMSRLPDLLVTPSNDNDQSVLVAQEVSKAVDDEVKSRQNRKVLGLASKHLPVYFLSCIKARWNPEIDDYVFEVIHPDYIDIDHTCTTNNADDMLFVSQVLPLTVQEIIMRFPKAEKEFLNRLKNEGLMAGENPSWSLMASTVKIRETWFTWYKKKSETEWERIEGVVWKYKDVILKKMKNPNFDYEGEKRFFAYDDMTNVATKRELNQNEVYQIALTGILPPNIKQEQVYHNYFEYPRKPFYFMGYDQWGKQPMDETSRIEQNLQNQKSIDKRGSQIEETLNNRGHNIFSKGALDPADVEEMDLEAPSEDYSVNGNPKDVHDFIAPERPTPQEFEELNNIRNRMYSIAGSTAIRGEIKSPVATTNQIAREADFTRADDFVEDTINDASQWMADHSLQFIKLRYTQDHFRYILGVAGAMVWMKLNRNMISEGMIVKIKASGTDKIRAQNNAMEMAKMQMTDPYTFFTDMGLSDPEGRTERLILAKADPVAYLQKVVKGLNTSQALAKALMNQEQVTPQAPVLPGQGQQQPSPTMGGQTQMPPPNTPPQQPSPQNTGAAPMTPSTQLPQGSPRIL